MRRCLPALQAFGADVRSFLQAVEGDVGNFVVGVVNGLVKAGATVRDAQDASAGGDQGAVTKGGAGVEHLALGAIQSGDGIAGADRSWITVGGKDDAYGGGRLPGGRGAIEQSGKQIGVHAVEQGLGFGVSEASVVLEDFGTRGGHHQTGIEKPGVGSAAGVHAGDGGLDDGVHDLGGLPGREDASVAVCAHAAGVGTGVAVEDGLVVLCGFERDGLTVSDIDNKADLFTRKEFFDQEGCVG